MTGQVRNPRNIDYAASAVLESRCIHAGLKLPPDWQLYVTDSKKGHARSNSKTCTVPLWAVNEHDDPLYALYYAAHEAAHAWLDYYGDDVSVHNKAFYVEFKRLCLPELWHYELEYKKTATKYGISPDPYVNLTRSRTDVDAVTDDGKIIDFKTAAEPPSDDDVYDAYVRRNPKLKKALETRCIPARERKGFIRGWAKLDK